MKTTMAPQSVGELVRLAEIRTAEIAEARNESSANAEQLELPGRMSSGNDGGGKRWPGT